MIAAVFLIALGIYLACGLVFDIPFALVGVKKLDPHAAHGSWGFRMLIIPGTMALWSLLLRRWVTGVKEPPEECNAHRACSRPALRDEEADSEGHARVTRHPSSVAALRRVDASPVLRSSTAEGGRITDDESLVTSAATREMEASS